MRNWIKTWVGAFYRFSVTYIGVNWEMSMTDPKNGSLLVLGSYN